MPEVPDADDFRAILRSFEDSIARQPVRPKPRNALQGAVAARLALAESLRQSLEEYERKKANAFH
jgi:hypothetical protein